MITSNVFKLINSFIDDVKSLTHFYLIFQEFDFLSCNYFPLILRNLSKYVFIPSVPTDYSSCNYF